MFLPLAISIFILAATIGLCYIFRDNIRMRLSKWQMGLQLGTLRTAIHDADADKEETGRKNIVIFNSTNREFEPMQKRALKQISKAGKNKSNKSLTDGRKRRVRIVKGRVIAVDRVKTIERKSLYTTT